jgi:hypothetical protein
MATHTSTSATAPAATRPTATKVAAAASVLFAVLFFLTVASVDVPHKATGTALLAWWRDGANQNAGIVSMLCAIGAAVCFIVMVDHFRALVVSSGRGFGQLTQFAHSMATAFTAILLVSAGLRGVIGHLVKVDGEPLPGLDVLRLSTSLNYTLIGSVSTFALALAILAISAVVIKTRVLVRWVGILGIACGVVILGASGVLRGQYAISLSLLWALGLAVATWRKAPAT